MIKAEIYRNLATVSDDIIMDTFTHPYKSDNYEFMYDGIMWRGIDSGDVVMKHEEAIDRMIYKILNKIENK